MADAAMIVGLPEWLLRRSGVNTEPNLKYEPGDTGVLPDTSVPGQTSWTQTPPVTPWPTGQDVAGARNYKKKYGNPNEVQIEPYFRTNVVHGDDDPKGVSTAGQFKEWQLGSTDPKMRPAREQYGEATARDLYGSQLAANTSPLAALGFDPDALAISRPADQKNLSGILGLTLSGMDQQRGQGVNGAPVSYPMYSHMDAGAATTPVHESIHRGIAFLLEDPANKDLKDRMASYDDKGGTGNEYVTRAMMIRRYGNVEANEIHTGGKPHPQIEYARKLMTYDPKFQALMQDIDRRAAHMGAQKIITKQGGVFKEGGMVGDDLDSARRNVLEQYPMLGGHDWSIVDGRHKFDGSRQLEFYSPEESESPTPGRPTIEIFNPHLKGEMLERAIYGDMLHHLPSVDQTWAGMREQLRQSLTPEQLQVDQRAYQRDQRTYGEDRPFDDWMNASRLDAYVRGRLAPDANDNWRDVYTSDQHKLLDQMQNHLTQGHRYQEGGPVVAAQDGGKMWDDSPFGNWGTSDILHVARGVPGYEHLQQAAQDYLEKIEGHQRQGDTPGSYVAAGVRDVRSIPNEELKDSRKTFKDLAVEENRYPMMQTGGPVQQGGLVRRPYMRFIEPHVAEFQTDPGYPPQGEDEDDREPPPPGSKMGTLGPAIDDDDDDSRDYLMPMEKEPDPASIEGQVLKGERQSANEQLEYEEDAPDEDEQQRRHGKSARETIMERGQADRQRQKVDQFHRDYRPPVGGVPGYAEGGRVDDRIGQLMDDPEHGAWHHDGKFQVYTPHMSFFHGASPHELVDYFLKYHPDDHRLNLP